MTAADRDLVLQALKAPLATAGWSAADWSLLLQQSRSSGLLGRVLQRLEQADPTLMDRLPPGMRGHAEAARRLGRAQVSEIHREVRHLMRALADLQAPVVLLKGAAYVMAGLPPAQGRIFSDVDLMVPQAVLHSAESMLAAHGWMTAAETPYDQRYYREWMHEIPPMQHVRRGTTIDLHHAILPRTARFKPDPAKLFAAAVALERGSRLHVLAPQDMLLHGMTHLFMNDDMSHGLRDLSDLDLLLGHFAVTHSFWHGLVDRALELDLGRLLFYGLRYTALTFGRVVPPEVAQRLRPSGPPAPLLRVMDAIWTRALASPDPAGAGAAHGAALAALYLRGHWLRMPPLLLARHLTIKALRLNERGVGGAPAQGG